MTKRALITGGASGIGRAIAERLAAAGMEVIVVDLRDATIEADVSESSAWARIADEAGELDVACLNAGVMTGTADLASFTDQQYRRILGVNVDGVALGLRALIPQMRPGGHVVVTASLAGLVPMESDSLYSATKHFVVGLVRSAAAQLEHRGVRINAVCPGIADTPLIGEARDMLLGAGFPLLDADDVARAVEVILEDEDTGQAWAVQPGREPIKYAFRGVPGPRVAGAEGVRPPI